MAILNNDGQIQTVEAITAAIILISSIALIVEATSVTPLTSSFTNQHVKLELQNIGVDILSALDETPNTGTPTVDPTISSQLKDSIVQWLVDTGGNDWYACTDTKNYVSLKDYITTLDDNPLADTLSLVLLQKNGISYNVEIRYPDSIDSDGNVKNTKMIWNGDPSDNSVTVSRMIVLHDDDVDASNCVVPDVSSTNLRNVVEVRLTLWVM